MEITIPVQVNGKLRGTITINQSKASQENVVKKAMEVESVKKAVGGKEPKIIYVKEKILNFVE